MKSRVALLLMILLASAASCDQRPTYAEFEARTWQTACTTDRECVLVDIPCDPCGGELAVSTSERATYDEYVAKVSCDDYPHEDDCGDAMDMEPACNSGRCTARVATDPSPEAEPPEPEAPSECETLRARAAALIATPSASCESDDDCGCYPAFVDCGGVRDAASAAAIGAIAGEGRAGNCGYVNPEGSTFNCAPWQCTPTCRDGACGR